MAVWAACIKNMNKISKVFIGIAIVLVALAFAKDFVIKMVVEAGASKVLGAPVHIGGVSVGLFKQSVRIKDLRVGNPSGFPAGTLIDIPEAGVDYDLGQIMKGNLHLPMVILNLKELNVVKNAQGKLNVDSLQVAQKKTAAGAAAPAKTMPMQIDTATLNLGKVTVKDYTKNPASVQTLDIGIHNKIYHNITSAQQLVLLVMVESMRPTALREAAIYGAASLLGVAFLPVGVADALWHQFHK